MKKHHFALMQNILISLFTFYLFLVFFIPLNPAMPSIELDGAWSFAINQAVAQGLVFGKEIIFTFGPYGSIYTNLYHPAVSYILFFGNLYLSICFFLLFVLLENKKEISWSKFFTALTFGVILTSLMFTRDSIFFFYPLLLALLTYRITLPESHPNNLSLTKTSFVILLILFTPLGFLPLIKGSFLLICAITMILCFSMLFYHNKKLLSYLVLISPLCFSAFCWVLADQPLSALPHYFISFIWIVSGYSEAMAIPGNKIEIIYYFILALLLLYCVKKESVRTIPRIFLLLCFSLFLFISFKEGFVRHDQHAVFGTTSLILGALALRYISKNSLHILMFLLTFIVWYFIYTHYMNSNIIGIYKRFINTNIDFVNHLNLNLIRKTKLNEMYKESVNSINKKFPIGTLVGTSDIYSFKQTYLLSSENVWSPRPIFQSYSVYTSRLAKLNELHLRSKKAPDNIIFRLEPIDGHLPALEDGYSWPTIINNYSVVKLENDFLYLKKRPSAHQHIFIKEIYNGEHRFGEIVNFTETKHPLYAEINISPTVLGIIRAFLFKPPLLSISINLNNGTQKSYRLISTMAKLRFLISPLVESTQDFALFTCSGNSLKNKIVKSIQISSGRGVSIFWNKSYNIKLYKINILKDTAVKKGSRNYQT